MTTRSYPQWTPEAFDPAIDPLSTQVGERETEDVQRDPLADAEPKIVRVFNGREAGIVDGGFVDHGQHSAPTVERVEQRGHLDPPPPSTDPYSDDQLNRLEGVPHHKGILRGRDDRGRKRFEIRFRDRAGNIRTQPVSARDLDAADQALAEALLVEGRSPIK